jgi:hypothetical protein
MDADRLDSLARSLARSGRRRTLLCLLTGGALGLAGWPHADDAAAHNTLKKCKKIEDKKKRKACIKKAKKHNATHTITPITTCTPTCGGRTCGDNGCGGSCGACGGSSSCIEGICTCPSPQEFCGGTCVPPCEATQARNPISCGCCTRFGNSSVNCDTAAEVSADCCSGKCDDDGVCRGKVPGAPCQFDAQCASGICDDSGLDVNTCD